MDSETINAISSLWPLALILLLLVTVILFRVQIRAVLDRSSKIQIRRGDTEVVIVQRENTEDVNAGETIPSKISEESTDTSKNPSINEMQETDIDSISPEELQGEMYFAFFRNNIERAEEIFNKLQSIQHDQIDRFRNEAFFLYLKFTKGDTNALEELKKLTEKTKSIPIALSAVFYNIGRCYQEVSQFEQAINAYKKAEEFAEAEEKKATCITSISNCHFSLGYKELAFNVIEDAIGRSTNPEALGTLYLFLAKLFEKSGDKKLRGIALEKALETRPNDSQIRFDTAYSYSEGEFIQLTLFHYKKLVRFSPNHRSAYNNLGVAYKELEMPINSITAYKKAWEQKETIAAANLAYQYLADGFLDEAKKILADAKSEADIHPNVGSALAAIASNEKSETSKEKKALDEAMEQQRFFLEFAEAYFKKISISFNVDGTWLIDGTIAEVTQTGTQFAVTWGEGDTRRKIFGRIKNQGAMLDFEKWGFNLAKMNSDYINDGKGYAFLSSDLNTFHVMKHDKKDFQIMVFARSGLKDT